MCPDPCPCIQGCIAIFNCAKGVDDDELKLEKAYKYLEDNRSDLNQRIIEVQQLRQRGAATIDQSNWLERALSEKTSLEDILGSETSPKPLPSFCLCCCIYCCGLGAQVDARQDRLRRLLEHPCLKQNAVRAQTPLVVPLAPVEMIGMDSKFQEFWRIFDDESAPLIGIHGMPGTGKSAFLMNVNNEFIDPVNRRGFEKVIWVASSSTRDVEGIQNTIADRLGLESPPNVTKEQRAGAIHTELKGINFVLLLDNLPDGLELSAVGVPYPPSGNEKKCKIVFTAQRTGIWSNLRPPPRAFDLGMLDNGSATLLFNSKVGEETLNADIGQQAQAGDSARPTIRDLADTIVHMCSGLPIALVKIGEHLRNQNNPAEWMDTIDRLKCPESAGPGGPEESVYQCLNSAYTSLRRSATQVESLEQKCFLYCCLFPGDHPVEEEELKRHWVAEDFLHNDNLHRCLGRGDSILDTLKRAHLLMSARDQPAIEMHLQIYNLGRWISSRHLPEDSQNKFYVRSSSNAELVELPTDHGWAQVGRISLVDTTIGNLNRIECSRLSTLILKHCTITNISNDFFVPMKTLKVLNLSGSTLPDIPSGIAVLTCLQYLNLSHSNIRKLTEDFKHLRRLIALNLSFTSELEHIAAGVLSNLSTLQWLNMYYCGVGQRNQRGSSSSPLELMALLNEVQGLHSLQDLGITVRSSPALTKLGESHHLDNIHSILITDCDTALLPRSTSAASELEVNLTVIAYAERLKVLHIISCRALLRFQETSIRAEQCFQNLRDIKIENCRKLKDLNWLTYAQALESLEIGGCPNLTKLIAGGHGIHGTAGGGRGSHGTVSSRRGSHAIAAGQPSQLPFSKLKYMHLEGLSILESICFQNLEFRDLMKITVLSCSNLTGISIDVSIARQKPIPIICQKLWWEKKLDRDTKSKLFPIFQ